MQSGGVSKLLHHVDHHGQHGPWLVVFRQLRLGNAARHLPALVRAPADIVRTEQLHELVEQLRRLLDVILLRLWATHFDDRVGVAFMKL